MKNKALGAGVWTLAFILVNVLLFCLERGMTATFWITASFIWVAFISSFIAQMVLWNKLTDTNKQILHIPAFVITNAYMILQFPIGIIFALGANAIPYKAAIIVNALLLVIIWTLVIGSIAGNEHIQKVNSRQKDHHIEL